MTAAIPSTSILKKLDTDMNLSHIGTEYFGLWTIKNPVNNTFYSIESEFLCWYNLNTSINGSIHINRQSRCQALMLSKDATKVYIIEVNGSSLNLITFTIATETITSQTIQTNPYGFLAFGQTAVLGSDNIITIVIGTETGEMGTTYNITKITLDGIIVHTASIEPYSPNYITFGILDKNNNYILGYDIRFGGSEIVYAYSVLRKYNTLLERIPSDILGLYTSVVDKDNNLITLKPNEDWTELTAMKYNSSLELLSTHLLGFMPDYESTSPHLFITTDDEGNYYIIDYDSGYVRKYSNDFSLIDSTNTSMSPIYSVSDPLGWTFGRITNG